MLTELAMPFLFVSLVSVVLGFGVLLVLGIVEGISRLSGAGTAEIGWSAVLLLTAGVLLLLVVVPIAVIGLRRQGRAHSAVRRYFRFGSTTSTDLARAMEHAGRARREAMRRLRRQRAPWRWLRKRHAQVPAVATPVAQAGGTL